MENTTNYHLKKPEDTDERKISDLNDNADVIDAAMHTIATTEATTSARGMMSAADKTKLNGIAASANNYSLPLAANGTRGGAQIGYTQNGKNYPVQLSSEKMYVNVPWENTTYSAATTSAAGLMSAADKTKLNGIAAGANKILWDVVDISTGSVSAGALKDIEKVLSLPSSDTLIGISGVYPLYGNLEIRGFSISTANGQKSIILKVRNPSNVSTSDTLYVGYIKNVI